VPTQDRRLEGQAAAFRQRRWLGSRPGAVGRRHRL